MVLWSPSDSELLSDVSGTLWGSMIDLEERSPCPKPDNNKRGKREGDGDPEVTKKRIHENLEILKIFTWCTNGVRDRMTSFPTSRHVLHWI